jgi:hypothetical protein
MHELDGGVGRVGGGWAGAEGDQGAAAGEGASHRVAGEGELGCLVVEELGDDARALGDRLVQRRAADPWPLSRSRWS